MTHATRVAAVAVLVALVAGTPVQAQTLEVDALRERAEQGDANAQYRLGDIYNEGRIPQDEAETEAVRWYRLAAEQGHVDAQFELGSLYRIGEGVPQDYVQAYIWLDLAASRMIDEIQGATGRVGDPHDPRPLDERIRGLRAGLRLTNTFLRLVEDELTPDDISEAQHLIREWGEAHPR